MGAHPSTANPPSGLRATLALVCTALAFAAAAFYNGPANEIPLLFWSALAICLGLAVTFTDASISRLEVAATIAVLWLFLTWRASVSPSLSIAPTWSLLLLPLGVLLSIRSQRPGALLSRLLPLGSLVVLAAVLDFYFLPTSSPVTLSDPNNVATLTNLLWPPALFSVLAMKRPPGPLLLAVVALGAGVVTAVLVVVDSRGGVLVCGCLVLVSSAFAWRRARPVVLVALACGASLTFALLSAFESAHQAAGGADQGAEAGIALRLELARAALELLLGHPFTGTGPQTFHILYPALRTSAEQSTAGYFAHNDWLQISHETGLPGAFLLLAFAVWLLRSTLQRGVLAWAGDAGALIGTATGLAALGALAHALLNFTLYVAPLALLVGLWAGMVATPVRVAIEQSVRAGIRMLQALVLALMLGALALDALSATALMGHVGFPGRDWLRSAPTQERVAKLLVDVNLDDSVPAAFLAQVRQREAAVAESEESARYLLASAIAYHELAIIRDPYDREALLAYAALIGNLGGTLEMQNGTARSDIELLNRAHRADPSDVRAALALGGRLLGEARLEEERRVIARWLPQCRFASRSEPEASARLLQRADTLQLDPELRGLCARAVASRAKRGT